MSIIGHAAIRAVLQRIQTRPAPAYGFFGPEHVGKWGVAKEFAVSLVAPASGLAASAHPDILALDARVQASIDEVKAFLRQTHQTSAYGGRRVFLIDHADELGTAGMNALLKDIEEPRVGTVFLLIASRPDAIPVTVRSRLVPLRFDCLNEEDMLTAATALDVPLVWVKSALGRPGLLQRRKDDPAWWEQTQVYAQRLAIGLSDATMGGLIAALDEWQKALEKHPEADVRWRVLLLLAMSEWTRQSAASVALRSGTGMAYVDAWRLLETAIPARVGIEMAWLREHLPDGRAILPRI